MKDSVFIIKGSVHCSVINFVPGIITIRYCELFKYIIHCYESLLVAPDM